MCIFQNRKLVLQPCSWKIWTICIRFIREMSLSKRHHYQSGYHFLILSIYYKPTLSSCLTAFISKALLTIFLHSPHYHLPPSMSSLVYLLVWSPPPHIPYISSPNQCLLLYLLLISNNTVLMLVWHGKGMCCTGCCLFTYRIAHRTNRWYLDYSEVAFGAFHLTSEMTYFVLHGTSNLINHDTIR